MGPGSHLGKLNPEPREEEKKSPIVDNLGQKQDSCLCADDRAYQGRGGGRGGGGAGPAMMMRTMIEFGGVAMSENVYS